AEFNAMMRELTREREELVAAAESREALEMQLQRLDKLATIGELSAGLAHEIGSPLQVLHGRARAIATPGDLPAQIVRSGRVTEKQSDRIARIVEQLLTLARRKPAQMAEVDPRAAVAPILELMAIEARRRRIDLQFEAADALPHIWGDLDQIQQILMNL